MADEKPEWEYKIEFAKHEDTHHLNTLEAVARWLGNESSEKWELVAVAPFPPHGALAYYFRRPADRE